MRAIFHTWAIAAVVVVAIVFISCSEDRGAEGTGASSELVRALWNPAESMFPTPTDLVRDEETGTLAIPVDDDASQGQREFIGFLNDLDGYPLSTPIKIPVSAPIDEATLGRGVRMFEIPGDRRISVDARYDAEAEAILVEPRQELEPGQRYVVGLRGYEFGTVGQQGQKVVADAPFFLVRSPRPLTEHPDAMPGDTVSERMELAEELSEVQEQLRPAFDLMARQGIERKELAVLFEFSTTSLPAVQFDAAAGEIPFPNDILIDPDGGGLELPIDDDMTAEEQEILLALSKMDGFSMSAAITVRSTHGFASTEPSAQAFRLFQRQKSGQWTEFVDVQRGRLDEGRTVWLRPELTLEPETDYIFIATDELETTSGTGHRAQSLGAILGLTSPVADEGGTSLLDQLTDSEAQRIEPLRLRVDELLRQLEVDEGLERHRIAAAVPFQTAGAAGPLLERRAALYERNVTTDVIDLDTTMPSGGAGLLLSNVDSVIRGKMTILDYLDPETRVFYTDGEPVERQVKFVLTLPEDVPVEKPLPVVLFGHGLMTSRELLYLIAGELAGAGYAALSLDLPYHGARSVCLRDNNCEGHATCEAKGQCRNPDGTKAELSEVAVPYLSPFLEGTQYDDLLNYPMTSGEVFIDIDSLVGTRDHFAQALLDLSQAVRVLNGEELTQAVVDETGLWVGDDIVYLGMSLGGILGSGLAAVEPEIDDFVVNVPAGDLTRLIEHSIAFETAFEHALDAREIERGSDDYFAFMNAARWLLDPIDPLNLVQHIAADRLTYIDPVTQDIVDDREARILIQMAEGDRVVPNIGTEILSERMGIDYIKYSPTLTDHAFLFDPTPFSTATRNAREDMVEFFDGR